MSCGLHDVVAIEGAGRPAAIIGTEAFRSEAVEQARILAMPEKHMIEVPHPIQPIPLEQVYAYADQVVTQVLAQFTGADR